MMLKNYGESSDVSEMVLYLCTKKSKYINAENIVVDGGLTKKGIWIKANVYTYSENTW